jgi:hypothetical protein
LRRRIVTIVTNPDISAPWPFGVCRSNTHAPDGVRTRLRCGGVVRKKRSCRRVGGQRTRGPEQAIRTYKSRSRKFLAPFGKVNAWKASCDCSCDWLLCREV